MNNTHTATETIPAYRRQQAANSGADRQFLRILWGYSISIWLIFPLISWFDNVPGLLLAIVATVAHASAFLIHRWSRWRAIVATQCVLLFWLAAHVWLLAIISGIYALMVDPNVPWQE
ncbi:MAG TPA: hypothetical protein DDW52_05815 [Planctomycetaceae bacterium]|nr:hypothetical protein [Planctomycetaceae bacterium]